MPDSHRGRSVSGELDTDFESQQGDPTPGKPGRKKNPNSQAARRDQNRIAQREFRLRKQQRIRDLEARVEILSGGQDQTVGEMRNMLKDLMAENHALRGLIKGLSGFIGDGTGGVLTRMGWDQSDFEAFVNRSETDTVWEGYQQRKKNADHAAVAEQRTSASASSKRPLDTDSSTSRTANKKARADPSDHDPSSFPLLSSLPSIGSSAPLFPPPARSQERNGIFSEIMQATSNPTMFMQSPSGSSTSPYPSSGTPVIDNTYPSSYIPIDSNSYDNANSSMVSQQRLQQPPDVGDLFDDDSDDPKKMEAYKLIHYHLENYKRNTQYCLPASLRPSMIQRTIPHEGVIDRVLHPELRDRMILFRKRYELVDCLIDLRKNITIHGDDVLAHSNWEISAKFVEKYPFLIDVAVLRIANRWRRERGEPELTIPEDRANPST